MGDKVHRDTHARSTVHRPVRMDADIWTLGEAMPFVLQMRIMKRAVLRRAQRRRMRGRGKEKTCWTVLMRVHRREDERGSVVFFYEDTLVVVGRV